jgi:hypothetical protein
MRTRSPERTIRAIAAPGDGAWAMVAGEPVRSDFEPCEHVTEGTDHQTGG